MSNARLISAQFTYYVVAVKESCNIFVTKFAKRVDMATRSALPGSDKEVVNVPGTYSTPSI